MMMLLKLIEEIPYLGNEKNKIGHKRAKLPECSSTDSFTIDLFAYIIN